jgi:amino acid transporter
VSQPFTPYGNAPIYRAPAPGQGFAPLSSGLRTAFLIIVVLAMLAFVSSIGCMSGAIIMNPDHPDDALMIAFLVCMVLAVFLLYAQIFVGLFWIYKVWSWLPEDQRWSKHWKGRIDPAMAAGMMLIPYFHYYWMFVIDCGICDAMDRLRTQFPTTRVAPKQLAIAACICQLVIPLPVGSILWLMFMGRIEEMTRDMSAAAARSVQPGMGPALQY